MKFLKIYLSTVFCIFFTAVVFFTISNATTFAPYKFKVYDSVSKRLLIIDDSGSVWAQNLSANSVGDFQQLTTGYPVGSASWDKTVLFDSINNRLLVINTMGEVYSSRIYGIYIDTPTKMITSTPVGNNSQDKTILFDNLSNRLLVTNTKGEVYAYKINGDSIGNPTKLTSSYRIGNYSLDKSILFDSISNRILVITANGEVYAYKINGNSIESRNKLTNLFTTASQSGFESIFDGVSNRILGINTEIVHSNFFNCTYYTSHLFAVNINIFENTLSDTVRIACDVFKPLNSKNWVSNLSDNTLIEDLSIPGTHDSGSKNCTDLPGARCQNTTIAEQLSNGVRFLDIRCRNENGNLSIYHGSDNADLSFEDVLRTIDIFLRDYPYETVIMSLKAENSTFGTWNSDPGFSDAFNKYLTDEGLNDTRKYGYLFYKETTRPMLKNIRGKIVLLNRFDNGFPWGINAASDWSDNNPDFKITTSTPKLRIQDKYDLGNNPLYIFDSGSVTNTKWSCINSMLENAKNHIFYTETKGFMHINFTSGFFNISDLLWNNGINGRVNDYFNENKSGCYGAILMDYMNEDLCKLIYKTNLP